MIQSARSAGTPGMPNLRAWRSSVLEKASSLRCCLTSQIPTALINAFAMTALAKTATAPA